MRGGDHRVLRTQRRASGEGYGHAAKTFRDEHVVRVLESEHLNAANLLLDRYGMNSIGHEVLNPLHPGELLAGLCGETYIGADAGNCSADFLSTERPSFGVLLVDDRKRGTAEDTGLA